jgi:hypothetical protein
MSVEYTDRGIMTRCKAAEIAMNGIRDVRLVLLKGTKTDVTAIAKDAMRQRFMRLMIDEFLDHKRNSQVAESVEDAAVYAIARVVGFVRGVVGCKDVG